MRNLKSNAILGAACVGLATVCVHAAPLANYSILGRVVGSGTAYASSVTVSAGSQVEYKLVATFAPIGTVNIQGASTRTLTSITATDGFNNTPRIDLFQTSGAQIDASFSAAGTPQAFTGPGGTSTWSSGIGHTPGTPTSGDLFNIKNIAGAGPQLDAPGNPIYLGTFSIASVTGSQSLVGMRITSATSAGSSGYRVHVNNSTAANGSNIIPTDVSESGAQPLWSLNGLTLVQAQTNLSPSFTLASGLQAGDTGIDVTLDVVQPVNSLTHFATFSIPDSLITDEAASTTTVTLGSIPTALAGHISVMGRNIIVSGSYADYPAMIGTFSVPLVLTDNQSTTGGGTFTVQIVPEPASIGLLCLSGALLRRRKHRSV